MDEQDVLNYIDRICNTGGSFPPVKWREGAEYDDVVDDPSDWLNHEFVMVRLELFDLICQMAEVQGVTPADLILSAIEDRLKMIVVVNEVKTLDVNEVTIEDV